MEILNLMKQHNQQPNEQTYQLLRNIAKYVKDEEIFKKINFEAASKGYFI